MNLIYIDRDGVKTKGWMTSRELDRVLGAGQGTELEQPAYFMPALTKRVAVEVKNVRFEDGTEWSGQ